MVRSLLCVMLCTSCLPVIQSHSWLACADWDECSGTCHGYARNWHKRPSNPFGTDVGRDIRPGADVPLGLFCDPNKEGSSGPVEDRYSGTYPMAKVRPGQKLVWQWPAKNHADVGTQRGVQLFISKGPGLGDDFSHITSRPTGCRGIPSLRQPFQIAMSMETKWAAAWTRRSAVVLSGYRPTFSLVSTRSCGGGNSTVASSTTHALT